MAMPLLFVTCWSMASPVLKTGDPVPVLQFNHVYRYPGGRVTVGPADTNLVVLDFWSTHCTSCIRHFPSYDSLQQAFTGRLRLLLVNAKSTYDDSSTIKRFYNRWEALRKTRLNLPTVMEDTLADRLFPHEALPHCVWLYKGRVLAITGAEEINEGNINKVLLGEPVRFSGTEEEAGAGRLLASTTISRFLPGYPTHKDITETGRGVVTRISLANTTLFDLLRYASRSWVPINQVVREGDTAIVPLAERDDAAWKARYTYCYEQITPPLDINEAKARMLATLEQHFHLAVSVEKRELRCLVLRQDSVVSALYGPDGEQDNNFFEPPGATRRLVSGSMDQFTIYCNAVLPLPVVNGTGITRKVSLSFKLDGAADLPALSTALAKLGLSFHEETRPFDVLVIRSTH